MATKLVVTEKLVKDKVKKLLGIFSKYNAIYSLCPMTFGYGESGHPDRIILINGTFIGIEVKKDKNNSHCRPELKPKPNELMQKKQAAKIEKSGGIWICIHNENLADLVNLLTKYCITEPNMFSESDKKTLNNLVG